MTGPDRFAPVLDIRKAREAAAATCEWCPEPAEPRGPDDKRPPLCAKHMPIGGRHPWRVGQAALDSAEWLHDMPAAELLDWPWQAINELAGPLVPGRLHYVTAFPGNGKTTFLMHCLAYWLAQGKTVTLLPLESDPGEVYTRLACYRTGLNSDDVLSKRMRIRADAGDMRAIADLAAVSTEYRRLRADDVLLHALRIEPIRSLTPKAFIRAVSAAEAMESDLLLVDHVDHAENDIGESGPEIALSNQLQQAALNAAIRLSIPVVLASQLNSSRTGGDRLAHYRAPLVDWMYNKGKKEQTAAVILGLYRPTDPNADQDVVTAVRQGREEPSKVVLPERMGVAAMKLRYGGSNKERTTMLKYENGRLSDVDGADARQDAAMRAGFETGRSPSDFGGRHGS